MVVQPNDTVARLADIDLRNIVILILVDEIIDARTFDARDVFRCAAWSEYRPAVRYDRLSPIFC